jgi:hypothetical protein
MLKKIECKFFLGVGFPTSRTLGKDLSGNSLFSAENTGFGVSVREPVGGEDSIRHVSSYCVQIQLCAAGDLRASQDMLLQMIVPQS